MPRKADAVTWRAGPVPSTAMQRSNFIDACVASLVGDTQMQATPTPLLQRTCGTSTSSSSRALTYTSVEMYALLDHACSTCDAVDARPVIVNPYAQRSTILLCNRCGPSSE
jgi:hypothetical protein